MPSTALKIRSELSRRFQRTVLKEAEKIFSLIEGDLFIALGKQASEAGVAVPKTRFDHLLEELEKVPSEESDDSERDQLVGALKASLSDVIVGEVKKLFDRVRVGISPEITWIDTLSNLKPIGFDFEEETERELSELARQLEQTNRRVRWHARARNSAVVSVVLMSIAGILTLLLLALNYTWAEWGIRVCISAFVLGALTGFISIASFYFLDKWLETRAGQITSGNDYPVTTVDKNGV